MVRKFLKKVADRYLNQGRQGTQDGKEEKEKKLGLGRGSKGL